MVRGWAIAWYRKEDWPQWRAICPDFAPEYGQWLAKADAGFKQTRSRGLVAENVMMDPEEFLKWTSANGGKVDSSARSQYAAAQLAAREGSGH